MIDLKVLRARLRQAGSPWRAAATPLHLLPTREKRRHLGFVPGRSELPLKCAEETARAREERRRRVARRRVKTPQAWDWRNVGGHSFVTSIKDQDTCLACTAFGTIATIETTMKVHHEMPHFDPDYAEGHKSLRSS